MESAVVSSARATGWRPGSAVFGSWRRIAVTERYIARVSLLRRLFGSGYAKLAAVQLGAGPGAAGHRVELTGELNLLEPVHSPVDGRAGALLSYAALARSAAGRLHFGVGQSALDLRYEAEQGRDFILRDASGAVLVRVDPGRDVSAFHDELRAQHGVELDAETRVLGEGDRVRVRGEVLDGGDGAHTHPHRAEYRAVVRAHAIERA